MFQGQADFENYCTSGTVLVDCTSEELWIGTGDFGTAADCRKKWLFIDIVYYPNLILLCAERELTPD